MSSAEIRFDRAENGTTRIVISGRANFETAVPIRDFVKKLPPTFRQVSIDLGACTGMDSTFMGVLSMLGLQARKCQARILLENAGDGNRALLSGLGVAKLFTFVETAPGGGESGEAAAPAASTALETAETVLEAHRTLMDADAENVKRFQTVVEMAGKDVEELRGGK